MQTYRLQEGKALTECVGRSLEVLRAGGVVLYPTDTLYGLGADAFSDEAVAKIYEIKGRDEGKPMHAMVADLEMAGKYGEVNDVARELAHAFLPGPLTLILKKKNIDTGIARGLDTIGIRIVNNPFCLELVRAFGKPITATSANKSGEKPGRSIEEILSQLGTSQSLIAAIFDGGEMPGRQPSTVVDVSSGKAIILREGALSANAIMAAL